MMMVILTMEMVEAVHVLLNLAILEIQVVLQFDNNEEIQLLKTLKVEMMEILTTQMDEVVLVQLSLGGPEMQVVLRYDNNVVMG